MHGSKKRTTVLYEKLHEIRSHQSPEQKEKILDEHIKTFKNTPVNEKKLRNEQAEQARSDAKELRKGGRAMYKSGMRVCKLAKKGKGRAYGKNS